MCPYRTHCVPLSWMRVFLACCCRCYISPAGCFLFPRAHNPSRVPLGKSSGTSFPPGSSLFAPSGGGGWGKGRVGPFSLSWPAAVLFRRTACVASRPLRSLAPRLAHSRCAYAPHRRTAQAAATSPPGLCRRGEIGPVVLCCSQPPVVSSDSHGCALRCLSACSLLPARALRLVVRSSRREL